VTVTIRVLSACVGNSGKANRPFRRVRLSKGVAPG
jgi:hypothetical protein